MGMDNNVEMFEAEMSKILNRHWVLEEKDNPDLGKVMSVAML